MWDTPTAPRGDPNGRHASKPRKEKNNIETKTNSNDMKRIPATLLWASSLLLLLPAASCTDTLGGDPDTDARAITFTPAAETRAAVDGGSLPDDFKVWGWYGESTGNIDKNVFNGTIIKAPNWTYDGGAQYWIPGMTYNFYGVYPAGYGSCTNSGVITVEDFDCSAFGEKTVDLMTATAQGKGSNPAPVAMQFKHTLTRITFSAKLADRLGTGYSLQVKEIALWASNKGNMTQTADGTIQWETEPYLTAGENESDIINDKYNAYLYRLTTENGELQRPSITTGNAVLLNVQGKGDLLVIPQEMNYTRPVLAINYTLSYGGSTTSPIWKVYPLKGNTDWTPGTSLNYTFTIDEDNAYFIVSVGDWIDGNSGNEDIVFE